MNLKELINKKRRAYEMHEKNTNRLNKIFGAKIGMMVGITFAAIGAIVLMVATGGFAVDIGAGLAGVGVTMAGADYIANIAFQAADRKARKQLQKEFPEQTKSGKLRGYAMTHSRDVINEFEEIERSTGGREHLLKKLENCDDRVYDTTPTQSVISKEEEREF